MPRFDDLLAEDLDQIRRLIEETDIDALTDEMRELVETHWLWLLEKLPLRTRWRDSTQSSMCMSSSLVLG
jgi:hypothetical protein